MLLPHIPCCRRTQACPFDTVCEMNTHIICIPCDEMSRVMDNQCVPYNPWLLYLHSAYCFPLVSYNMSRLLSDLMKTIIMATKISFFLQSDPELECQQLPAVQTVLLCCRVYSRDRFELLGVTAMKLNFPLSHVISLPYCFGHSVQTGFKCFIFYSKALKTTAKEA